MDFFTSLKKVVAESGPKPVITWLSDIGRIELSAVTFANAISKASNFLVDGLELDEDSSISVDLGNHWQSPVWLGAAFATGITITNQDSSISFGTNAMASTWKDSPEKFVVISQDPFGMPDKDVDPKFVNGSAEVRNFGDYFAPTWPASPELKVLISEPASFSWDELQQHAEQLAAKHKIEAGKSYGLLGSLDLVDRAVFQVVIPIVLRSSVVLVEQTTVNQGDIMRQEKLDQIVELS